MKNQFDVKKIRKDFPILNQKINGKKLIYVDNCATTQKPIQVINSMSDYYLNYNSNVHRGAHTLANKATQNYESSRAKIARFVNCKKEEVIFTKGTTNSMNMIAFGLFDQIKKGDEIVLSVAEHHANIVPWQIIAKKKQAQLKFINLTNDYELDLKHAKKIINKKTKIVSLSHISNVLGTINPIDEINKIAKKFDAITIFDMAQSIGHKKCDFKKLNADFIVFSSHKMYGPMGVGCLIGKYEILDKLTPFEYGGDMIYEVEFDCSTYAKLPNKLEAGTPNVEAVIGLSKAIDYINEIGIKNIEKYENDLTKYFLKEIKKVKNFKLYGKINPKNRSPIFSFNLGKIHSHDMSDILDQNGIAIRGGHHCAMPLNTILKTSSTSRISLSFYNTKEEIDKIIKVLNKVEYIYEKGNFLLK